MPFDLGKRLRVCDPVDNAVISSHERLVDVTTEIYNQICAAIGEERFRSVAHEV